MLTQERVKELFDYREDGKLIRKIPSINGKKAGSVAGSLHKSTGYIRISVDGKTYREHRIIWLWHYGYMPENDIDHKDRIRKHNWIDNLREMSRSCNLRNTGNPPKNTSGVKGVSWRKQRSKWTVCIRINNNQKVIGTFKDFTEAVCHRLCAEQCLDWDKYDNKSPAFVYISKALST